MANKKKYSYLEKGKQYPYLYEFAQYLEEVEGLAPKTVERHAVNARFFLFYMSTNLFVVEPDCREDEVEVDDKLLARGKEFADHYLSYFLLRTAMLSSSGVKECAASVKKFYKFLGVKGILPQKLCTETIQTFKKNVPFLWPEDLGL